MIMTEEKKIIAYKAFNKDLQCRDFQYEVGKEYQTDEKIKCCRRGFHAFESPLEVWCYRGILNARFAKVELSGTIDRRWNGFTKICSSHIKIKEELKLADIIKLGVKWLENATSPSETETDSTLNDKGDTPVRIASNDDYVRIGSSGNSAQIGSSGDGAKISSTGEDAVVMCAGPNSKAKAKKRSWITLSEWRWDSGKRRFAPVCVRTEYVDGERIKADTWYQLINGKFKEVQP
nr:MAG TPA: hypothetical protein [Caudoviricetes sp.]